MESILCAAERILQRSDSPALRLSRLVEELRRCPGVPRLDGSALRALLHRHPERFRVLDPWRGPWRPVVSVPGEVGVEEAWVVAVTDPGDGAGWAARSPTLTRLRESVRWLGLSLDPDAPRRVIRWRSLVLEAQGAREVLARAA